MNQACDYELISMGIKFQRWIDRPLLLFPPRESTLALAHWSKQAPSLKYILTHRNDDLFRKFSTSRCHPSPCTIWQLSETISINIWCRSLSLPWCLPCRLPACHDLRQRPPHTFAGLVGKESLVKRRVWIFLVHQQHNSDFDDWWDSILIQHDRADIYIIFGGSRNGIVAVLTGGPWRCLRPWMSIPVDGTSRWILLVELQLQHICSMHMNTHTHW